MPVSAMQNCPSKPYSCGAQSGGKVSFGPAFSRGLHERERRDQAQAVPPHGGVDRGGQFESHLMGLEGDFALLQRANFEKVWTSNSTAKSRSTMNL